MEQNKKLQLGKKEETSGNNHKKSQEHTEQVNKHTSMKSEEQTQDEKTDKTQGIQQTNKEQTIVTDTQGYKKVEERIKTSQNKLDKVAERLNMTRISEERSDYENGVEEKEEVRKKNEEDVTLKFPNLVDSVRVAEGRISQNRNLRNVKSLKYIFPTSYIGNSTTTQATVNQANTTNSMCVMPKKTEYTTINKSISYPVSYSGIPVPKNNQVKLGTSLSAVVPVKRLVKNMKMSQSHTGIKMKTNGDTNGRVEETSEEVVEEELRLKTKEEDQAEENKDDFNEKMSRHSGSSSASVITSPSEVGELKEEEGQTYK
jgi:hypothetical protein